MSAIDFGGREYGRAPDVGLAILVKEERGVEARQNRVAVLVLRVNIGVEHLVGALVVEATETSLVARKRRASGGAEEQTTKNQVKRFEYGFSAIGCI